MNRLTDITQTGALAHFTYNALSQRTALAYGPSGAPATAYAYTNAGQIASLTHTWSGLSLNLAYSYNKDHQRAGLTASDATFLPSGLAAASNAYTANALNQYSAISHVSLSYDGNRNLAGDGTWTYAYDNENRLVSASKAGTTATYAYDPLGRRKSKAVNGVVTNYLSAGAREIAEYNGAGALLRRFVYGPGLDEPLATIEASGAVSYHFADAQGSVIALSNASGLVTEKHAYTAYGLGTVAAGTPYQYAGRRLDPETGLYYNRARMYSPTLGRFLQTDPIGTRGGINLYAYVGNDPVNLIDPFGLCPQCLGGAAIGATIGLAFQAGSDLWNWQFSSFSSYAGAVVGGAAGGAAATICGPACAGAAAGAASNLVTSGLSGTFSAAGLVADTAVGAAGGAVLGQVVQYAFKNYVSNPVKGGIGEGLTQLDLLLNNQTIVQRSAANGVGRSTFDFLLGDGSFVESKFGTSGLSTPQRRAAAQLGDDLRVDYWDYPMVSGIGAAGFGAGAAGSFSGSGK